MSYTTDKTSVPSRKFIFDNQNAGNRISLEFGDPGWIRTSDLSLRRRTLYPTELRDQGDFGSGILDFGFSANPKSKIPNPKSNCHSVPRI